MNYCTKCLKPLSVEKSLLLRSDKEFFQNAELLVCIQCNTKIIQTKGHAFYSESFAQVCDVEYKGEIIDI